jgi:hypothetical protein
MNTKKSLLLISLFVVFTATATTLPVFNGLLTSDLNANQYSITNANIVSASNFVYLTTGQSLATSPYDAQYLTGTVPLARLSGVTSNQLDAGTWQAATSVALNALDAAKPGIVTNGTSPIFSGIFTNGNTVFYDRTNALPPANPTRVAVAFDTNAMGKLFIGNGGKWTERGTNMATLNDVTNAFDNLVTLRKVLTNNFYDIVYFRSNVYIGDPSKITVTPGRLNVTFGPGREGMIVQQEQASSYSFFEFFTSGGGSIARFNESYQIYAEGDISSGQSLNAGSDIYAGGTLNVDGDINAGGSKNFLIPNPVDETNSMLRHAAIESPRAELIYRGRTQLTNGFARVSIDKASGMRKGTFKVLTRNPQVFNPQNETGWSAIHATVQAGDIVIQCQDTNSADTVSWLVIAERADANYLHSGSVDAGGTFVAEPVGRKRARPQPLNVRTNF